MLARIAAVVLLTDALLSCPAAAGAAPAASAPVWVAPLGAPPVVTRGFDPLPDRFAAGHRGVDLGGTPGAAVVAAGDGVVVFAGMVAGRPVVSIAHPDGLRTTYEPVEPAVHGGQPVSGGSVIGRVLTGHAGCPVQACLHWGLRRGEIYLDPLLLLHLPQVRLLPWP